MGINHAKNCLLSAIAAIDLIFNRLTVRVCLHDFFCLKKKEKKERKGIKTRPICIDLTDFNVVPSDPPPPPDARTVCRVIFRANFNVDQELESRVMFLFWGYHKYDDSIKCRSFISRKDSSFISHCQICTFTRHA